MNREAALQAIEEMLGNRASTADVRRVVYSHDMGTLPDVVKKFISTMPDMVVQPESEEEVSRLVALAAQAQIPLIPRGSASSGMAGQFQHRAAWLSISIACEGLFLWTHKL